MRATPEAVVAFLRRAEREGDCPLADFLAGEIVRHLERLDRLEDGTGMMADEVLAQFTAKRTGGDDGE